MHGSVVEDLNSTNGIFVRAKRVRRRMLNDGDVVQIGQHEIMYFDERLSHSRAAGATARTTRCRWCRTWQANRAGRKPRTTTKPSSRLPIRADRK